jgi:hypothetical protein
MRESVLGGPMQASDLADLIAGLEGRWSPGDLDALRAAYAEVAGGVPAGLDAAMVAARTGLHRRDPR